MAGIDLPEHLDGEPLSRHLDSGPAESVLIQISESEVGRALRTDRWKYHVLAPDAGDQSGADNYRERALYDLHADPYELDNLIDSQGHQELLQDLRRRLIAKIDQVERRTGTIERFTPVRDRARHPETTVRPTRAPRPRPRVESAGTRGYRLPPDAVKRLRP